MWRGGESHTVAVVPRFFRVKGLWEKQGPLLALIGVISVVYGIQVTLGKHASGAFMVVPAEIVRVWDAMRSGEAVPGGWREFGTLLSYAFLHGSLAQGMMLTCLSR